MDGIGLVVSYITLLDGIGLVVATLLCLDGIGLVELHYSAWME